MLKRRKSKKSDRKYWIDKLDEVFSLYIRMRDSKEFGFRKFRCISCNDVKDYDQMDAGHFIGRACMVLRWDESNVHGECRHCNRLSSSHLLYYRKNLIIKLGTKKVEWLEAQKFESKKWSVEELQQEYCYYAALVLKMKEEM